MQWIDLTKKRPTIKNHVFIFFREKMDRGINWCVDIDKLKKVEKNKCYWERNGYKVDVTHWLPMPEFPKDSAQNPEEV